METEKSRAAAGKISQGGPHSWYGAPLSLPKQGAGGIWHEPERPDHFRVYQSTTGRIVPVDTCLIEDEKADQIVVSIRKLMKSFRMTPYQSDKGTGFLRHVLVKRGFVSGEIMVVLVTTSPDFSGKE